MSFAGGLQNDDDNSVVLLQLAAKSAINKIVGHSYHAPHDRPRQSIRSTVSGAASWTMPLQERLMRRIDHSIMTRSESSPTQTQPTLWKPAQDRSPYLSGSRVYTARFRRRFRGNWCMVAFLLVPVLLLCFGRLRDSRQQILESSQHSSELEGEMLHPATTSQRQRAAIISLVRNEELDGILQSMRQLEHHWNKNFKYPWIFFSEQPLSDEFKSATSNATLAQTSYELIPKTHWSTPEWVDADRYMDSLDYLDAISVGKGYMLSYRNMCRWNSGFFYKHPALQPYQYYWRVEPDVHFFCDVPYDPFAFMAERELVYGFNMNILDDARSFASLWEVTMAFITENPQYMHEDADLAWLVNAKEGDGYNNCQFFSNFEIGSLDFFRGAANEAYFEFLDRSGGFFYERYGDAPVHTLSVALFAPKDKVWFFHDIGYQHDIARHCPLDGVVEGRCNCEPTSLDENFYKLVPMESPQHKPQDTCIRQWLGGEWLGKKEGWNQEAEKAFGGDGFGGYVKTEWSF